MSDEQPPKWAMEVARRAGVMFMGEPAFRNLIEDEVLEDVARIIANPAPQRDMLDQQKKSENPPVTP